MRQAANLRGWTHVRGRRQLPLLPPGELLRPGEARPIRVELWWCQDPTPIEMEPVVGVSVPPHLSRSIAEIGVLAGLADPQQLALAVVRRGRGKAGALNVCPIAPITDFEVATILVGQLVALARDHRALTRRIAQMEAEAETSD